MSSCFLQVPDERYGRRQHEPTSTMTSQEIPSRCIGAHQLNSLLTSIFPAGGYLVDIDQDVYKIRAPREISKLEISTSRIR